MSSDLIEEQAARIAELEAQVSEWRQKWEEDDRDVRYFSKAMKAQQDRAASQARLSEAVKVLERLANANPKDEDMFALPQIAQAFITTLGGEK